MRSVARALTTIVLSLSMVAGSSAAGQPPARAADAPSEPRVGKLVAVSPHGELTPFCTAAVVRSRTKDVIITAAHCLVRRQQCISRVLFFPDAYSRNGQVATRFTTYRLACRGGRAQVWFDSAYAKDRRHNAQRDVAFARLEPSAVTGRPIEKELGGFELDTSGAVARRAIVRAHPNGSLAARQCRTRTTAFRAGGHSPGTYIRVECTGLGGGSSGGPFIGDAPGYRKLFGVIGGFEEGGSSPDVSYSPVFGSAVRRLFDDAVTHRRPANWILGDAATWRHAQLLTGGRYASSIASELTVRWSDGEFTRYRPDRRGGFVTETRVGAPGSVWRYAQFMTGGGFAPGMTAESVLTVWRDGEVTASWFVGARQRVREQRLLAPNRTWTSARALTSGAFGSPAGARHSDGRRDDVLVRWKDGEVSLFYDVGANGLGPSRRELRLASPGSVWQHARLVAAGAFGAGQARQDDLFVVWSDGEVSLYADIATRGLSAERTLAAPSALWSRHAHALTAGDFDADGWSDDLVVRWTDGELSRYADVGSRGLGRETTLVAP